MGDALGGAGDPAHRQQHDAAQAEPEPDQQQRGHDRAAGGEHEHAVAQRLRVVAAHGR